MALKKFLDWSEFARKDSAVDLFKESVRESLKFDFYGDRDTFKAIALTPSYPLTDVEAKGIGAAFLGGNVGNARKHKFKARIIDENSPHMFLPNPCDPAVAGDKASVVSLVQKHTDVIQINAGTITPMIARGDIVEIQLQKNVFCYDLQMAIFNRKLATNDGKDSLLKSTGCEALVGAYEDLDELTLPLFTPVGDVQGRWKKKGNDVKMLINQARFMDDLVVNLQASYIADNKGTKLEQIMVTSGYRNAKTQAQAMYGNWVSFGKGEAADTQIKNTYGRYHQSSIGRILGYFKGGNVTGATSVIREMQVNYNQFTKSHFVGNSIDLRTNNLNNAELQALAASVDALTTGGGSWDFEPYNCSKCIPPKRYWDHPSQPSRVVRGTTRGVHEHLHINLPTEYKSNISLPKS